MTTTIEHTPAEAHTHKHGADCGHEAIKHGTHVDYLHDGHAHTEHEDHYDECTSCKSDCCNDDCTECRCEKCDCPTCQH